MTQLIIIAIYLASLLVLGVFASRLFRGTSKDYMLASHSIGPFLLLMSIFGTTMTAFALVGSTGESFKEGVGVYGMLASSSGIIHSLCFFVIGVKMWKLGKKYGYTTQVEFFRDRLGSDKIGLLLFPILVALVIPYLLIGVDASGIVINSMTEGAFTEWFAAYDFGVPDWVGSLIVCIVVLIYVFFGGMRGTAWANAFQTCVFMVLGVVTFFFISNQLEGMQKASENVFENNRSKLMREVWVVPKEEDPDDKITDDYEKYEKQFASWQVLAHYNYAVNEKGFEFPADKTKEALGAFKLKMPGWQVRARAAYALKNGLMPKLSETEIYRAELLQDDRIPPEGDEFETYEETDKDGKVHKYVDLHHYDRTDTLKADAMAWIKATYNPDPNDPIVGHPDKELKSDPSKGGKPGKKWTRKKAGGWYKAANWAPEKPHGTNFWKFLTYLFVPLSVGMFPHLFQHWLTAKNAASFKLPVVVHPVFIMIVWVPCVLVGVWATSATMPGSPAPVIPPHFPANAVLPMMVKQLTPPILGGFLTAGILAAIMSSLDSQFLCLGTMFTHDIVLHYAGRDKISDKNELWLARGFIIVIVAITFFFSLFPLARVFQLGVWCFSGFASLFPLIVAAIYWKRLTKPGAYAGILAAIISWGVMFWQSDFAKNSDYDVFGLMPVTTMIVCSTIAMVVVSLVTKPPEAERLARFFPDMKD